MQPETLQLVIAAETWLTFVRKELGLVTDRDCEVCDGEALIDERTGMTDGVIQHDPRCPYEQMEIAIANLRAAEDVAAHKLIARISPQRPWGELITGRK